MYATQFAASADARGARRAREHEDRRHRPDRHLSARRRRLGLPRLRQRLPPPRARGASTSKIPGSGSTIRTPRPSPTMSASTSPICARRAGARSTPRELRAGRCARRTARIHGATLEAVAQLLPAAPISSSTSRGLLAARGVSRRAPHRLSRQRPGLQPGQAVGGRARHGQRRPGVLRRPDPRPRLLLHLRREHRRIRLRHSALRPHWLPTRQPIVLERLAVHRLRRRRATYTTVMSWKTDVTLRRSRRRRLRRQGRRVRRVPRPAGARRPCRCEVALAGAAPRDELAAARLAASSMPTSSRAPSTPTATTCAARAASGASPRTPTSRSRSGWFSTRSAAYLALGKPVVVQDTGLSAHYPTGAGIFRVRHRRGGGGGDRRRRKRLPPPLRSRARHRRARARRPSAVLDAAAADAGLSMADCASSSPAGWRATRSAPAATPGRSCSTCSAFAASAASATTSSTSTRRTASTTPGSRRHSPPRRTSASFAALIARLGLADASRCCCATATHTSACSRAEVRDWAAAPICSINLSGRFHLRDVMARRAPARCMSTSTRASRRSGKRSTAST